MSFVVLTLISVVVVSCVGNLFHRLLHVPKMGRFHRAHMQHHLELYPVHDLTSEIYREADVTKRGTFLFAPALIVVASIVSSVAYLLDRRLVVCVVVFSVFVSYGLLNEYVHDSFHLRRHYLQRFVLYRRLRRGHFFHHVDMSKNFGIVERIWDRVFGTSHRRDT